MKQIRFHGRGGQGAVTAAEILGLAASEEKKWCQAFPFFGVERRGAPVKAFTRISDEYIKTRQQIYKPDYVVVLDSTLMDVVDTEEGNPSTIVVNTKRTPEELDLSTGDVQTIHATKIALDEIGKPFANTPMLGALAAATGVVKPESLKKAIKEKYPGKIGEKNANAIQKAYEELKK